MTSKHKDVAREEEKPVMVVQHLSPHEITAVINGNEALRRVVAILVNGKRSQGTSHAFLAHDVWMQRMLRGYNAWVKTMVPEERLIATEDFLHALQRYLELIPYQTPQSGRSDQAPELVEEVRKLMGHPDIGLAPVGKRILSILNVPQ